MYKIENRFHTVILNPHPDDGLALRATLQTECDTISKSPKTELVFKDGRITNGYNDRPGYVFRDLRINGQPTKFQERTDGDNRRSIFCSAKASPNARNHISFVEEFLVRKNEDFINRLFGTNSRNVGVTLKCPKILTPTIKWLVPEKTARKIRRYKRKSTGLFASYREELHEEVRNGEGFRIFWNMKKGDSLPRTQERRRDLRKLETAVRVICFFSGLLLAAIGAYSLVSTGSLGKETATVLMVTGILFVILGLGYRYIRVKTGPVELEARQ